MDSKLKEWAKALFTWSRLEGLRVKPIAADPRQISEFQSLDELVAHSLKAPSLIRTQTAAGNPLPSPKAESRSFRDETLIRKLLQQREKTPLSSRIIRP